MPPTSQVLIIGAGDLGLPILTCLATRLPPTSTLTVLLRPLSSATTPSDSKAAQTALLRRLAILTLHVDIATASHAALVALLAPFATVIVCTGMSTRGTHVRLAEAAAAAGVHRYVPWQFGVDYDMITEGAAGGLFDEQKAVRRVLRGQESMRWVVVSTGLFASFLFEGMFGVVEGLGAAEREAWGGEAVGKRGEVVARALGGWETEVTVTATSDIGAITADIVLDETGWAEGDDREGRMGRVVYVAGETVTYGKVAEVVEKVLGREVTRELWTVPELEKRMAEDPNNVMKKYQCVFGQGVGVSWPAEKTWNAQKKIHVMGVEDWPREALAKANRSCR